MPLEDLMRELREGLTAYEQHLHNEGFESDDEMEPLEVLDELRVFLEDRLDEAEVDPGLNFDVPD